MFVTALRTPSIAGGWAASVGMELAKQPPCGSCFTHVSHLRDMYSGLSYRTVGMALAWHMTDLGLISATHMVS